MTKEIRDSLGRIYTQSQHCMKQAMDLMWQGRMTEGLDMLRAYLAEHPQDAAVHTMLLFFSHYALGVTREDLFAMHREWAVRHAPVTLARSDHDNDPDPQRRLRIGYVSPDFYSHAVTFAFENLLLHRDRDAFEVFGYGSVIHPDTTTERLRASFDVYHDVFHLTDEQLAQRVREDRVDILVNIAGLVAGHRLGAFAYKPAPIQIDFQGVDTTGLPQMDYRLTDAILDPEGSRAFHVEKLIRLPRSLACYAPPKNSPEVGPLPYQRNGFVTFGSFNVGLKLNPSVVALWSRVLRGLPTSGLLLKVNTEDKRLLSRYVDDFAAQGIAPARVTVLPRMASDWDHYNLYSRVDIALDTHPFNGGITTLDSLWMGLPVVTWAGDRFVSRMGYTILTHAGLGDLVVHGADDFVTRALALAQAPEALARLRANLRPALRRSPICDARDFIGAIETVYRQVWCSWCDTASRRRSVPAPADLLSRTARQAQAAFVTGNTQRARSLYLTAIEQGVDHPTAFQTLGELYLHDRDFTRARPWLERAWDREPTPERLERLTMARLGSGAAAEAHAAIGRAQAILAHGDWPPLICAVWNSQGDRDIQQRVEALLTLAHWFFDNQRWEDASSAYERVLALQVHGLAHARLGHIHRFQGRLVPALEHLRRATELEPDNVTYQGAYAHLLLLTGEVEVGLVGLERAVDRAPDNAELHSSYLFALNYHPRLEAETLARRHREWGEHFAPRSLMLDRADHPAEPERRLRIGYLGADFKRHSVGYTLEGILRGHHRSDYEIFAYGSVAEPDDVTERLRVCCDCYRDIQALSDGTAARLIRDDGIDILVAVAGHSYGHRLGVLAYKPAPIQVDYGGIHTTGLSQVDYRITDEHRDPPETQRYFLERFVYLPGGSTCYLPPDRAPDVSPLPVETQGVVTFGACHGAQKLNRDTLVLWGRVLRAVPGAHLRIKCPGGEQPALQARLREPICAQGLGPERVTVMGLQGEGQHLNFYRDVDIALDAHPFNGGVTTLEGLWMGVPIITRVGERTVARTGLSILAQLDMAALAARTPEQYIKIVAVLAANPSALARIRSTLRQRMRASTLCHHEIYVTQLERAYRDLWHAHCQSQNPVAATTVGGRSL